MRSTAPFVCRIGPSPSSAPPERRRPQLALFSLSGFTDALQAMAAQEEVVLVSGADLLETGDSAGNPR